MSSRRQARLQFKFMTASMLTCIVRDVILEKHSPVYWLHDAVQALPVVVSVDHGGAKIWGEELGEVSGG